MRTVFEYVQGALFAAGILFMALGVIEAVTFVMDHLNVCVK
jgi:hypothetical protein